MKNIRAYREIKCASYGDLCAYILAFEDLAHVMGCEYVVEPSFINVETLVWSRIVRVGALSQEELLPFRELLDSTIDQVYEYLAKAVERSNEIRRVRGW